MKKIFCEDCRYWHRWDESLDGYYYKCWATKKECINPIRHYWTPDGDYRKRNKNNTCAYYTRKWWKFWKPK